VFEKNHGLLNYVMTGTRLEARVHADVLYSLFQVNSPLHDGAIILFDGRIQAAGCFLPLSKSVEIDRHFGTRHRAALGVTEVSDAVVVVVSEETGRIQICSEGFFHAVEGEDALRRELRKHLIQGSRGAAEALLVGVGG
jgi:diadenylate cyclase